MKDEGDLSWKRRQAGSPSGQSQWGARPVCLNVRGYASKQTRCLRSQLLRSQLWTLVLLVALLSFACASSNRGSQSIPLEVESTVSSISEEIAAERYDKVYNDASELWRQDATLEESTATFKTLRKKLGPVESRMLQSATEQQNSGGPLKGRAYIVNYRTKFQIGEGMETFTLVERGGRWLLARYFVNSTALK